MRYYRQHVQNIDNYCFITSKYLKDFTFTEKIFNLQKNMFEKIVILEFIKLT